MEVAAGAVLGGLGTGAVDTQEVAVITGVVTQDYQAGDLWPPGGVFVLHLPKVSRALVIVDSGMSALVAQLITIC